MYWSNIEDFYLLDFLYIVSIVILSVCIKNGYQFINKIQKTLSQSSIKQKEMIKVINGLVDRCKKFENEIKEQARQIIALNEQLEEKNKYIANILKENKELKKNLEFYTEIDSDSSKLNSDETITSVEIASENKNNITDEQQAYEIKELDEEQQYAFNLLNQTDKNLFITGKAGTGKSYLLREFAKQTNKKILLLAPTGISAININGATLHSTFGFDNLVTTPLNQLNKTTIKLKKEKISLLKVVDIFIIDEISMVSADVFEKINKILQIVMNNKKVFGGKRFILFGDLFQLPPIANAAMTQYMKTTFGGIFFFFADAYKKGNFEFIELTINHRQEKDKIFFDILNNIRQDNVTDGDISELNKRFCDDPSELRRVIKLFSRKNDVDKTNRDELEKIKAKEYTYKSIVTFSKNKSKSMADFPISDELRLKVGALIMMVMNDPNKQWVNGTLGIVKKLTDDSITVVINGIEYNIPQAEFTQQEAIYENGKIEYVPIMTVKQFPLILAYAITIHKSQGMTYQQIACDVSNTFATGQAYVALSRCTTLEGLYLLKKISKTSIFNIDEDIKEFYQQQTNLLH